MGNDQLINHLIAKTDRHEKEIEALKILVDELQRKLLTSAEKSQASS